MNFKYGLILSSEEHSEQEAVDQVSFFNKMIDSLSKDFVVLVRSNPHFVPHKDFESNTTTYLVRGRCTLVDTFVTMNKPGRYDATRTYDDNIIAGFGL